jgi:hypothetical protein
VALPLLLRNRLAELILDSLHDPRARNTLSALVRFCGEPEDATAPLEVVSEFPAALHKEHRRFREELCERTRRAWEVVRERPLAPAEPALGEALDEAADLFDARLFFEVHELLEPYWMRAEGATREALQGLIQIAVGFQHLVNGNLEGARMHLEEGSAKVEGKQLEGRDLSNFARAVRLGVFSRFPRGG